MARPLFEYSSHSAMHEIWDHCWSETSIERQLKKISEDEQLPIFLKHLPKEGKILEGGCGLGKWVIYFKQKGYDIVGVDFAREAIKLIKNYNKDMPVFLGDVNNLSFPDNYFDAYISLGVVEHMHYGSTKALLEAKRVLKDGGMLFISVPVINPIRKVTFPIEKSLSFLRENNFIRNIIGKKEYPNKEFIEFRFNINEFTKILAELNFKCEIKFPICHYWFNFFNHFNEPLPILRNSAMISFFRHFSNFNKEHFPWLAPGLVMWVARNYK